MDKRIYNENMQTKVIFKYGKTRCKLVIISCRGMHPCMYIQFPGIEKIPDYDGVYFESEDGEYYNVHGGFTFLGTLDNLGLEGTWLGWDYAHYGDYICTCTNLYNKYAGIDHVWSYDELICEGIECIEHIMTGELKYKEES